VHSDSTSSTTAAALAVDIRRFPWIRRLATDYAFDYARVAPFFAGDPARPQAWADAISRRHAHGGSPDAIARVIAAQQERRNAPAAARTAAAHLAEPRTVVIITGQQAGLFGGPLFTLLKAITTMKLAEQIQRAHGVQVVPVFWIDAEDHDWPEVNHCTVLGNELEPRSVTLGDLTGAGQLPIGRLLLDDRSTQSIELLAQALPESEFRASIIENLRRAYRPGVGMAEAFGCWLEATLGERGLVVFDASDPAAKPLVRDVFIRELKAPGESGKLAEKAGAALVAAGYHSQVTPTGGAVSLFHLNAGRSSIRISDGRATVGDRETTLDALVKEAE
jgi:bacillithiol biosynthesis cysteine-adding enzyme BshC